MTDNGYHIIPIKPHHQLEYGERAWLRGRAGRAGRAALVSPCASRGASAPARCPCCLPTTRLLALTTSRTPPASGCNCLNLGGERIISVHMETARQIVQSPHFFGDVQCIDYRWEGGSRWGSCRAESMSGQSSEQQTAGAGVVCGPPPACLQPSPTPPPPPPPPPFPLVTAAPSRPCTAPSTAPHRSSSACRAASEESHAPFHTLGRFVLWTQPAYLVSPATLHTFLPSGNGLQVGAWLPLPAAFDSRLPPRVLLVPPLSLSLL